MNKFIICIFLFASISFSFSRQIDWENANWIPQTQILVSPPPLQDIDISDLTIIPTSKAGIKQDKCESSMSYAGLFGDEEEIGQNSSISQTLAFTSEKIQSMKLQFNLAIFDVEPELDTQITIKINDKKLTSFPLKGDNNKNCGSFFSPYYMRYLNKIQLFLPLYVDNQVKITFVNQQQLVWGINNVELFACTDCYTILELEEDFIKFFSKETFQCQDLLAMQETLSFVKKYFAYDDENEINDIIDALKNALTLIEKAQQLMKQYNEQIADETQASLIEQQSSKINFLQKKVPHNELLQISSNIKISSKVSKFFKNEVENVFAQIQDLETGESTEDKAALYEEIIQSINDLIKKLEDLKLIHSQIDQFKINYTNLYQECV